jgi:hypothetical protein
LGAEEKIEVNAEYFCERARKAEEKEPTHRLEERENTTRVALMKGNKQGTGRNEIEWECLALIGTSSNDRRVIWQDNLRR